MAFVSFTVAQNDLLPYLETTLVNGDEEPVDLSVATVQFRMASYRSPNVVKINNATAEKLQTAGDSTTTGKVRYCWTSGDTDTAGLYYASFVVTIAGKTEHFPPDNTMLVRVAPLY